MKLRRLAPLLGTAALLGFSVTAAHAQSAWNSVLLTWTAPGDDSLTGTAAQYDLRFATSLITAANFASATPVSGVPAPAASGTSQSFTVTGLSPATAYWFAIKTRDDAGNWSGISNVTSKSTASAPDTVRPAPASVAITVVTDTSATLAWNAVGDDSLTGTATSYDVRYSTSPITTANWSSATPATGEPAPAAPGTAQSFMVRGLSRQVTYYFALRTNDDVGNASALSNAPSATTTDTVRPSAITNLAPGFVWMGWSSALASRPRAVEIARP
ncbi:MAG: fibronectin type III domain-containing protein [Candidatus Eisenbacteria bacterium]|nr:fibronectin type III domain-containing protein [Candidatus Eisenbacteria bacterium]